MARSFEIEITKDEFVQMDSLLHFLALLSDLDEVQKVYFIWSNLYCRNMYGFSLEFDKHYKHLCRERALKNLTV